MKSHTIIFYLENLLSLRHNSFLPKYSLDSYIFLIFSIEMLIMLKKNEYAKNNLQIIYQLVIFQHILCKRIYKIT